ncbi:MAG: rhodanese-like domain-containing protein [Chloroflexales bacterium]|nr:rhodanese-like domain-containing protein [Chloroflexales bacterium]
MAIAMLVTKCILAAAGLIGLGAIAAAWWRGTAAAQRLAPDAVTAWLEATPDAVVVDVRTPLEYRSGHLPGARSLPLGSFGMQDISLPPDRPLLLVCQHGPRSRIAAAMLARAGFTQLYELRGGISRWKGPIVLE